MAKIAVYDTYYEKKHHYREDLVGDALDGLPHKVVNRAWDLHEAVGQLLAFRNEDPTKRPDIVILGGRLQHDYTYANNPVAIHEPCTVQRRTWYGRTREVDGIRATFMLPQFNGLEDYDFPTVEAVSPEFPPRLAEGWRRSGIAAAVLSRVAKEYLPNTIRLGISSDVMFDAELHEEVLRGPRAVAELRGHIARYADGSAASNPTDM